MLQAPLVLAGPERRRLRKQEPLPSSEEANLLSSAKSPLSMSALPSFCPPNILHIAAEEDKNCGRAGCRRQRVDDQGDVAGALGGRPGVSEGHGRQQPDEGKGNKQPSLHSRFLPWRGTGQEASSLIESAVSCNQHQTALTRTASGISFSLETSGLAPGHAVTVWWMVANPDGGVAVLYAAGHVIDDSGTAEFGGYLQVGDSDGALPMGTDTTLEDALGAMVFLVVRDHGPAKPGMVTAQIHLRCLQPDLHRPADLDAPAQLRSRLAGEWVEAPHSAPRLHHATAPPPPGAQAMTPQQQSPCY
jgi:hypothetical protein